MPNRRDLDVFNAATFKGNMKLTCAICVTVPTEALPAHSGVFVERYSSRNDVTELKINAEEMILISRQKDVTKNA